MSTKPALKLGALLEVKENSGLAFLHFEHGEAMVAHPVFATWGVSLQVC